jgi:hypothetical protein
MERVMAGALVTIASKDAFGASTAQQSWVVDYTMLPYIFSTHKSI